jgi:ABC-type transporter MlaC component
VLAAAAAALLAASSGRAADEPVPVEPPPPPACTSDPAEPRDEVAAAFMELQQIHRARVPGPAGQRLLEHKIDELLERLVGFDVFVDLVLGDAWDRADEAQKKAWRDALEATLRLRYLKKLGSPLAARMTIQDVQLQCDKATVRLHILDRHEKKQEVVLQLARLRLAPDPLAPEVVALVWRAFDVAVDGVSLLETWRSRFRRIYEDGGVAAIDYHMRGLRQRYPSKPE